ncbi:MAG: prefoldin subunit beta [Methanobacteriaceae archaeon]|nr:prefoldin subunit beta [Methanobacteriaceae archaeon]
MDIPENVQEQLNQFQQLQQQAQAIAMQKQAVETQLNESKKALKELAKSSDDNEVYKTAGSLLIKTTKKDANDELKETIETLEIRQKTVGKQEERITKKLKDLQSTIEFAMRSTQQ